MRRMLTLHVLLRSWRGRRRAVALVALVAVISLAVILLAADLAAHGRV